MPDKRGIVCIQYTITPRQPYIGIKIYIFIERLKYNI